MSTGQQLMPQFFPNSEAAWLNLFVLAVVTVGAVLITAATKGRLGYKAAA